MNIYKVTYLVTTPEDKPNKQEWAFLRAESKEDVPLKLQELEIEDNEALGTRNKYTMKALEELND